MLKSYDDNHLAIAECQACRKNDQIAQTKLWRVSDNLVCCGNPGLSNKCQPAVIRPQTLAESEKLIVLRDSNNQVCCGSPGLSDKYQPKVIRPQTLPGSEKLLVLHVSNNLVCCGTPGLSDKCQPEVIRPQTLAESEKVLVLRVQMLKSYSDNLVCGIGKMTTRRDQTRIS